MQAFFTAESGRLPAAPVWSQNQYLRRHMNFVSNKVLAVQPQRIVQEGGQSDVWRAAGVSDHWTVKSI